MHRDRLHQPHHCHISPPSSFMPLFRSRPFQLSTSSHAIAAVVVVVVVAVIVIIIIVAVVVAVIVVVVVVVVDVVVVVVAGVWLRRVRELGGLIGVSQCRVIAENRLDLT